MMDSMFESGGVEALALAFAMLIAVPSIIMLCFVLEEAPLKMDRSLDDQPVFIFWSATEMFGQGWGTLMCLFFVVFMLFGFAILGTSWYTVWRGSVAWNSDSTSLSDMMTGGGALLQTHSHALQNSTHDFSNKLWEVTSALAATAPLPLLVALQTGLPKIAAVIEGKAKVASKSLRASPQKSDAKQALRPDE